MAPKESTFSTFLDATNPIPASGEQERLDRVGLQEQVAAMSGFQLAYLIEQCIQPGPREALDPIAGVVLDELVSRLNLVELVRSETN